MELMIVVGILAVVALFAMPNLAGWLRKSDYRQAAQETLRAMLQARDLAITRNIPYRVVIDLPGQRYSLQSGSYPGPTWPAPGDAEWNAFSSAVAVRGSDPATPADPCTIAADADYDVVYLPNGTAAGTINLCIMAQDDLVTPRFQVAVDTPMTGRAFVRD